MDLVLESFLAKNIKFAVSGLIRNIESRHDEFGVSKYCRITNVFPLEVPEGYEPLASDNVQNVHRGIGMALQRTAAHVVEDVAQAAQVAQVARAVERIPPPTDLEARMVASRARINHGGAAARQADYQEAGPSGVVRPPVVTTAVPVVTIAVPATTAVPVVTTAVPIVSSAASSSRTSASRVSLGLQPPVWTLPAPFSAPVSSQSPPYVTTVLAQDVSAVGTSTVPSIVAPAVSSGFPSSSGSSPPPKRQK